MTDRDPRDPFPPLPTAQPMFITPDQLDLSRPYRFRDRVSVFGEVNIGSGDPNSGTSAILFVRASSNHINLVEVDGVSTDVWLIDVNDGVMRIGLLDLAVPLYTQAIAVNQDGTVEFPSGTAVVTQVARGNVATAVTFTNAGYLPLDAVTGGTAGEAIEATIDMPFTGLAQVTISSRVASDAAGATTVVGFSVSGATTISATDADALSVTSSAANHSDQQTWVTYPELNAGVNVLTLEARTTAGVGNLRRTILGVRPA